MALTVGGTPVTSVYVGSTPVTAVYVGSTLVWQAREVVQITLGTGTQARDQFRAALTARGLSYGTVTEVPFDIKLVGTGSVTNMFAYCSSLVSAPNLDTSQVTDTSQMFRNCYALVSVPDLVTAQVTDATNMFNGCQSLTNGGVRLIGKHPNVKTFGMVTASKLTRNPFFDTAGNPI